MAEPVRILTLNAISSTGLRRLPPELYSVGAQIDSPDAILVRSHDMKAMHIPGSVRAVGRRGGRGPHRQGRPRGFDRRGLACVARGMVVVAAAGPTRRSAGRRLIHTG